MDRHPYDEDGDLFTTMPSLQTRRSSLFNRWLVEQQESPIYTDSDNLAFNRSGTESHPYIAYPDISRPSSPYYNPPPSFSASSLESYDILEDADIPEETNIPRRGHGSKPSFFSQTAPSIRSLNFSFKSAPPSPLDPAGSRFSLPRLSIFPSSPGRSTPQLHAQGHSRSSSLGTLQSFLPKETPPRARPSVMGYFSSPSAASQSSIQASETIEAPSRPSMSSSSSTQFDPTSRMSKLSLVDSVRSKSLLGPGEIGKLRMENLPSIGSVYSDGRSPRPKRHSFTPSRRPFTPKPIAGNENSAQARQAPISEVSQPQILYSTAKEGSLSSKMALSFSRHSKKKKLVIAGVGVHEEKKFQGVKTWCQNFGDVSLILRMPNGDLHVYFKSAEVADMVCKLRAKVHISGVGSVNLSWFTGDGTKR